ncbi:hypothetical protein FRC08_002494 [Ceratobasidium sp. 394]|nr:hypothetical protein FRC08_002494 [Ceratobasidium sp. 394]
MRVSVDRKLALASDSPDTPTAQLPTEMILKVYDRRFALLLRARLKVKPAIYGSERLYQTYLANSPAEDVERLEEEMTACAAYERLKPLQGHDIPVFYGAVELIDGCSSSGATPPIQGILLGVIPGVGLDQVDPTAVDLEILIQNAIRIVDAYSQLGVINKDVPLGNFIVKPDGHVVMIDFAQSELRDEYECEKAWRIGKNNADEENRIYAGAETWYNRPWAGPKPKYPRDIADGIDYVDGQWQFIKGLYKGI